MKCKNYLLAILLLPVLATTAKSQSKNSKFYFKAYGGYGLLAPGSSKGTPTNYTQIPDPADPLTKTITTFETKQGLGRGLHYGAGLGYIVNEFINLGIDGEYLMGSKIKGNSTYTPAGSNNYYSNYIRESPHSVVSIIPNITFKALSKPSYYIYTRLGIVIAVKTKFEITTKDTSSYTSGVNVYNNSGSGIQKYEFKTGLGFQTSLGGQFRITENLRGFVELVGFYLSSIPTSSTNDYSSTRNTNGTPEYHKDLYTFHYKKSGQSDNNSTESGDGTVNNPIIRTSTSIQPANPININYIGVNGGLALRF